MDNTANTEGIKDSPESEGGISIIVNDIYTFHMTQEHYLKKQDSRNSPECSRKKPQLRRKKNLFVCISPTSPLTEPSGRLQELTSNNCYSLQFLSGKEQLKQAGMWH